MTADLALLADDPELAPLWAVIHERLCAGHEPESIASVKVPGLSPPGVAALRSWLDRSARRRRGRSSVPVGPSGASVPVRELMEVIGINSGDLRSLVELAVGRPVVNRAAARKDAAGIRHELWAYAEEELLNLPGVLTRLRAVGISDDDAPARRLICALATAVRRLPCEPPVSLAKLSHDCAGDPHYFDLDTYAGALLVSATAELLGRLEPARPEPGPRVPTRCRCDRRQAQRYRPLASGQGYWRRPGGQAAARLRHPGCPDPPRSHQQPAYAGTANPDGRREPLRTRSRARLRQSSSSGLHQRPSRQRRSRPAATRSRSGSKPSVCR